MAVKKVSKKKAMATRQTTDPAIIQEQLSKEAGAITERIGAPASNNISTRNSIFTFPDGRVDQGPIQLVIVDFISRNNYYDPKIKFDPKNPSPPICWAINKTPSELSPSPNSPEPQSDTDCAECPMNQFGSDGDAKACKNTRLLAVLDPENPDGDLMTLSVSATALRGFDAYVSKVANLFGVPPIGVITQVGFHPEKSYPSLIFGNPRPNDLLPQFFSRRGDAEFLLTSEPIQQEAAKPVMKKKVVKKRAARR